VFSSLEKRTHLEQPCLQHSPGQICQMKMGDLEERRGQCAMGERHILLGTEGIRMTQPDRHSNRTNFVDK